MTREQILYKSMILADLRIVFNNANSESKSDKLLAAYHMQQAIEKTFKLKLDILGHNVWGHDILNLISYCDINNLDIDIPLLIRKNAVMYTRWEANCRYYPRTVVNKNSIWAVYRVTLAWLNSGLTI